MISLIERIVTPTESQRRLADEILFACGWQTNLDAETIANGLQCDSEGQEYTGTFEALMDSACWYAPGAMLFRDKWSFGYAQPNPLASIDDAIALIPDDLYWLIGKGKTRPTEPLFGAQLFKQGSFDIPFAEAEHEDGPTAIYIAVLLARGADVAAVGEGR